MSKNTHITERQSDNQKSSTIHPQHNKMIQNPKGSIMILVIVMLITASAIGLLVMNYVNNMLQISSDFHAFNKAYYLAKGGIEMQMTKVAHRDVGFQEELDAGFVNTFDCSVGVKGNISDQCQLSGTIEARGQILTDQFQSTECTADVAYSLSGGDSIGFPLFFDNRETTETFAEDILLTSQFYPSIDIVSPDGENYEIGGSLVKLTRNAETERREPPSILDYRPYTAIMTTDVSNVITEIAGTNEADNSGSVDPSTIYFLIVFNPNQVRGQDISFCLQTDQELPLTHIGVRSLAKYRDFTIGMEATQTVDLPGFVFSTFIRR